MKIQSLAGARVERLKTYAECSVSGTGLHCIARAKSLDRIVKYDGVEIYTEKRFFTFTGRPLGGAFGKIESAEAEIQSSKLKCRTATGTATHRTSSTGAAWRLIEKHCPGKSEAVAPQIIKKWTNSGLLIRKTYENPVTRKTVNGLWVDNEKRPS